MTGPSWVPPRLAHLRRDARGLPVPYINLWGPSDPARFSIRHDRRVGGDALFMDDDGETVPDFTKQNVQRQRECIIDGLCQVCGRPVPWSRRYLVYSTISADAVDVEGAPRTAISEPWLDGWCARVAVERCPGLIRRKRGDDLSLLLVTSAREVELSVSRGCVDGPLAERTGAEPVFMWARIVLPAGVGSPQRWAARRCPLAQGGTGGQ